MTTTPTSREVELDKLLAGAQLPALPQSAIRLLELSQDPDNGPAEFAVPIEADPGLAGQVLRFVNSSYFGFAREIASVKQAITLVGIRTIKNFSLWSAVFSLMPNPKCGEFDLKLMWQDSLRRALLARGIGKRLGLRDPEDLFAAALLQDMAVPLLAKDLADDYRELLEARKAGQARLSDLERERFGWSHADAGATLARRWNLPGHFAQYIENHTTTIAAPTDGGELPGASIIALSGLLPSGADSAWHEFRAFETFYEAIGAAGGSDIKTALEQVDEDFEQFAPALKVSSPARSLVDYHSDATSANA